MLRRFTSNLLPPNLTFVSAFYKFLLGAFVIVLLMGYQPTLGFPPIKQSVVHAQTTPEQIQTIKSASLAVVFHLPHDGYITTRFSWFHPGIDLATALGTPIHPVADGVVISEGYDFWGLGNTVTVDHGSGYQSLYAHLGRVDVKKGARVTTSDVLGLVGLTGHTSGPHTHLQISKDGVNIDPLSVLPDVRIQPIAADFQIIRN